MFRNPWIRSAPLALALLTPLVGGCSKEKLDELVEKGKQGLDQGVQKAQDSLKEGVEQAKQDATTAQQTLTQSAGTAQEKLQLAGSIALGTDGSFKTSGCYARFVPAVGSRPAVLRIQSYRDAASEQFPSVFLRATVQATKSAELAGQTVEAQMFAQAESGGPVWFADASAPVKVRIVSVEAGKLAAEILEGTLTHSQGGAAVVAVGKIEGVLQ